MHAWTEHGLSSGIVDQDPFFWGEHGNPIGRAENEDFIPKPLMIGFTSFEGSLEQDHYYDYDPNALAAAYGGLGSNSYHPWQNFDLKLKEKLVTRNYQRMSCEYNFPEYQVS